MKQELQNFTDLVLKIKTYKEQHNEIFSGLSVLEENLSVAEQELKTAVKEQELPNEEISNGIIKIQKIRKWKRWLDLSKFSIKARKILKENLAILEQEPIVDIKITEQLARNGILDRKEIVNAYNEKELSPSIVIKIL